MRTGDSSELPDDILSVNNQLVVDEARSAYGQLFKRLANPQNLPLLFNCTHGKDRTGIAAVLCLLALNVPADKAKADYLASNHYRKEENEEQLNALRTYVQNKPGIDIGKLEAAFTILPRHFEVILESIESLHGDLESYFREGLGIEQEELEAMRQNLLEASP